MCIRWDKTTRIARAPAKLNLFLEVGGRRSDGFHEVATVVVPVRLFDTLALIPTPEDHGTLGPITVRVRNATPISEAPIPQGQENLVYRALDRLRTRSGCRFGATVELVKRIPASAGLGGGSSDAAAALRLANDAWDLSWPLERLAEIAAEIGSDVPFFLTGRPAICRGRGERVELLPPLRPLHFVVVKPPFGLSTREVYEAHDATAGDDPSERGLDKVASTLRNGRWGALPNWMHNRLQVAAEALATRVAHLHTILKQFDFVVHQLSGSGSAYFGVCRHAQHARRLATMLRKRQLGLVFVTRSCS